MIKKVFSRHELNYVPKAVRWIARTCLVAAIFFFVSALIYAGGSQESVDRASMGFLIMGLFGCFGLGLLISVGSLLYENLRRRKAFNSLEYLAASRTGVFITNSYRRAQLINLANLIVPLFILSLFVLLLAKAARVPLPF